MSTLSSAAKALEFVSPSEVQGVIKAGKRARNISKTYIKGPHEIRVDIPNVLTRQERSALYSGVRELHEAYPQVSHNVRNVRVIENILEHPDFPNLKNTVKLDRLPRAVARRNPDMHMRGINLGLEGMRQTQDEMGTLIGRSVTETLTDVPALKSVYTHEFGHWIEKALHQSVSASGGIFWDEAWGNLGRTMAPTARELIKETGERPSMMQIASRAINSKYAGADAAEGFAELFTLAHLRPKDPIIQPFVEQLGKIKKGEYPVRELGSPLGSLKEERAMARAQSRAAFVRNIETAKRVNGIAQY